MHKVWCAAFWHVMGSKHLQMLTFLSQTPRQNIFWKDMNYCSRWSHSLFSIELAIHQKKTSFKIVYCHFSLDSFQLNFIVHCTEVYIWTDCLDFFHSKWREAHLVTIHLLYFKICLRIRWIVAWIFVVHIYVNPLLYI